MALLPASTGTETFIIIRMSAPLEVTGPSPAVSVTYGRGPISDLAEIVVDDLPDFGSSKPGPSFVSAVG